MVKAQRANPRLSKGGQQKDMDWGQIQSIEVQFLIWLVSCCCSMSSTNGGWKAREK
jgi:hypothetical protein